MDKRYKPGEFENKIYKLWERSKAFTPQRNAKKDAFTIVMPPPNANAPLHIGHAMFVTLEDIMIRFQRMMGKSALWMPGADHAGILTQVVFERQLHKKGKSRYSLGRSKFYRQCLKFTQNNKKIMYNQLKKLGASCDWTREKFTLDPKISKQVLMTFIQLHKDKLVYRGDRLINWCPRCMTALSDLEVEHESIKGKFWYIKYPLKKQSKITGETRFLVVATTRPETMLGDTALAVHPEDKRYQHFIGHKVVLPLVKRDIRIIADRLVDPEFGTGVVKVTPAHDPIDWQIGLKHRLKVISVIGFDNKMTLAAGEQFVGLNSLRAREEIILQLDKQNLLLKDRVHVHSVAHCERCKTIVEPLISKQWFIDVNNKSIRLKRKKTNQKYTLSLPKSLRVKKTSLKQLGILAIRSNKVKILPKRFKKNYLNWMKNLHDWCISRQLWWGHRMPIWYCGINGLSSLQKMMNPDLAKKSRPGCGHTIVSLTKPKSCPKCRKRTTIIQDPDTFDTWFSSGQWAHNPLGFPNGHDYKYYYPTSVLETGYEILNIWVAKMIMLSLYRTNQVPFKTVYLHGLVRDAFGEKMSKSRGNVINPLDVIDQHGADALRMALIVGAGPGNDITVGSAKIKGYRNFTNKIWNIGRFIQFGFKSTRKQIPWYSNKLNGLEKEDKKIIAKLNLLIKQTTNNLSHYKFSPAAEAVYKFMWHEFADKYIEKVKQRVKDKDKAALSVLRHVYINCLKLLHPFIPFVTESVWQQFPSWHKTPGSLINKYLIKSSWPIL